MDSSVRFLVGQWAANHSTLNLSRCCALLIINRSELDNS